MKKEIASIVISIVLAFLLLSSGCSKSSDNDYLDDVLTADDIETIKEVLEQEEQIDFTEEEEPATDEDYEFNLGYGDPYTISFKGKEGLCVMPIKPDMVAVTSDYTKYAFTMDSVDGYFRTAEEYMEDYLSDNNGKDGKVRAENVSAGDLSGYYFHSIEDDFTGSGKSGYYLFDDDTVVIIMSGKLADLKVIRN